MARSVKPPRARKSQKPDAEHQHIAEIDEDILFKEDRSEDRNIFQERDGETCDLGAGDAGEIGAEEARQFGGQQGEHKADRHLVAAEFNAGEADEQGNQRADQHGDGNAKRDLQRHIQHAGFLRGPGGGEAQHRRQRQAAIERQVDDAGTLGDGPRPGWR